LKRSTPGSLTPTEARLLAFLKPSQRHCRLPPRDKGARRSEQTLQAGQAEAFVSRLRAHTDSCTDFTKGRAFPEGLEGELVALAQDHS
jgi:hypothetical protein